MTGTELLDALSIPVLYMADMQLPTIERTIELFREDIAMTVNRMAQGRKATEATVTFDEEDVLLIIRRTEEYCKLTPLLRYESVMADNIMIGVRKILTQLRSLLPDAIAV